MTATDWNAMQGADLVRSRRTTQQLVHDVLREAILSGEVQAGARLIQDEVAARFQISRVPVREALLQLEAEGLVQMEAHRGARVITPSPEEIEENLEIRRLLLIPTVKAAVPKLTDDHISELDAIVSRSDREPWAKPTADRHAEFYAAMLAPVNRPRLVMLVVRLEREIERFCLNTRPLPGHTDIVEACRARDGKQAALLVERHMEHFTARALARLREQQAAAHQEPVLTPG